MNHRFTSLPLIRFCLIATVALPALSQVPASGIKFDVGKIPRPKGEFVGQDCLPAATEKFFRRNNFNVCIVNRKFGDNYTVQVQKVVSRGTGVLEIRGVDLEAVTPAAANTSASPAAKGANKIESLTIPDWKTTEIVARFLNERTAAGVMTEYKNAGFELGIQSDLLAADLKKLLKKLTEMNGAGPVLPTSASASLGALSKKISDQIDRLSQLTQSERQSDEVKFAANVKTLDNTILDFRQLQKLVAALPFVDEVRLLSNDVRAFDKKWRQLQQNREVAQEAAAIARKLLASTSGKKFLNATRIAELRKELSDRFKASGTDEAEINRILKLFNDANLASPEQNGSNPVLSDKGDSAFVDGALVAVKEWNTIVSSPSDDQLKTLVSGLETELEKFFKIIQELNYSLASLMNELNKIQAESRIDIPLVIPVSVTESGNLDITFSLNVAESFKPYRFEGAAQNSLSTPAATTTSSASTAPANSGGSGTQSPSVSANPQPIIPLGSRNLETVSVHKFWRASFAAGFAFSSLRERSYSLQSCTLGQSPVSSATSVPQCVAQSDSQRPQIHYIAGVHYYFRPKDSYPEIASNSGKPKSSWMPGIFGGVALNKLNHFFIGPAFEPTLGIHIVPGYHFGQVTRLRLNVVQDKPVTASSVADLTRTTGDHGFFVMIGLDYKLFEKVFGGAKVKLVNP